MAWFLFPVGRVNVLGLSEAPPALVQGWYMDPHSWRLPETLRMGLCHDWVGGEHLQGGEV